MRLGLVVVVVAAGCGRLGFGGSDLDASVEADAPTDIRVCTPVGNDDDGDGIDDGCDVCPHLPGPHDDTDGDGVGDACDPNPNAATERIVRFETMDALPPDMTLAGPAPTLEPEGLRFDTRGTSVTLGIPYTPASDVIRIGLHIGAGIAAPAERQITIAMYEGPAYYYCELYDNGTFSVLALTRTFDGVDFAGIADTPFTLTPFESRDIFLELDHRPPTTRCSTSWPTTMPTIEGANPAGIDPTKVLIVLRGLDVRLDYLVHIRRD